MLQTSAMINTVADKCQNTAKVNTILPKSMDLSINNNKLCRLCIKNEGELSIFARESSIMEKIQSCCSLLLHENDGLPACICFQCMDTLDIVNNFIHQCAENDKLIRSKFSQIKGDHMYEVKIEKKEPHLYDDDNKNLESLDEEINKNSNYITLVKKENVLGDNPDSLHYNADGFYGMDIRDNDFFGDNAISFLNKDPKLQKNPKSSSSLCPYCGKTMKSAATLNNHLKMHVNDRPFICSICSKTFREKPHLKQHHRLHICEKQYPCETCGKLFKTKIDASAHHSRIHKTTGLSTCKICNKQLVSRQGLSIHMKRHTGDKKFQCTVCSKMFYFKSSLTLHLRVHTGEKPYSCRFCDSKFSIPKSLQEHERIHTGETPYSCPVCTKGFFQLANMKSHFKHNHKDVDFNAVYNKSKKTTNTSNNP